MKRLLVFGSGTATDGGSGAENLVKSVSEGILEADVVGFVSNHKNGGVAERANRLNIPFTYFPGPWTAERYQEIVRFYEAEFVALSGWLKMVYGLDPRLVFNIHPALLPGFGGKGFHGRAVHEAVLAAYKRGEVTQAGITMHWIRTDPQSTYDPAELAFFKYPVKVEENDKVEELAHRVNQCEHYWQPRITNKVIRGEIRWDGQNPESMVGVEDWTRRVL